MGVRCEGEEGDTAGESIEIPLARPPRRSSMANRGSHKGATLPSCCASCRPQQSLRGEAPEGAPTTRMCMLCHAM